jgi:hypothetical protein
MPRTALRYAVHPGRLHAPRAYRARREVMPDPIPAFIHLLRAKDLIDRRYAEPLDIARLAREAYASEAHFARSFKRAFGEAPHGYLSLNPPFVLAGGVRGLGVRVGPVEAVGRERRGDVRRSWGAVGVLGAAARLVLVSGASPGGRCSGGGRRRRFG